MTRRYPESALQMQTARIMRAFLREGAFAHHSPNEEMSATQRRIQAAHGTMPGFADWIILAPDPVDDYGRAYAIEMKAGRNGQTPAQKRFEELCGAAGVDYTVCRSVDEVLDALEDWGLLRPGVHVERRNAGRPAAKETA